MRLKELECELNMCIYENKLLYDERTKLNFKWVQLWLLHWIKKIKLCVQLYESKMLYTIQEKWKQKIINSQESQKGGEWVI